ncbi:hypothetical protein BH11BAC2_BH11BAC2_23300 [soil metagenome]
MDEKENNDKIWIGFMAGLIVTVPVLGILLLLSSSFPDTKYLNSPRPELYTLAMLMVLFRFLIVKWNRHQTGKGMLMFTFLAMLIYLMNHKYNFIQY